MSMSIKIKANIVFNMQCEFIATRKYGEVISSIVSVSVCRALTFEVLTYTVQYQGHGVKIKVVRAQLNTHSPSVCLRLKGNVVVLRCALLRGQRSSSRGRHNAQARYTPLFLNGWSHEMPHAVHSMVTSCNTT